LTAVIIDRRSIFDFQMIAEQGLVMADADALWLFGIALFLCMGSVFLPRKPGSGAVAMAH
jgi:hypothetical protein